MSPCYGTDDAPRTELFHQDVADVPEVSAIRTRRAGTVFARPECAKVKRPPGWRLRTHAAVGLFAALPTVGATPERSEGLERSYTRPFPNLGFARSGSTETMTGPESSRARLSCARRLAAAARARAFDRFLRTGFAGCVKYSCTQFHSMLTFPPRLYIQPRS